MEGSLLRSAVIQTNGLLIEQAVRQRDRIPQGNRGFATAPSDAFKTKTGWLLVQTIGDAMFERCCDVIGAPGMKTDPRFADDELRGDNSLAISQAFTDWCATKTRDEALRALTNAKIPCGPVYSPKEALEDAQIQASGLLTPRQYAGMQAPYPVTPHPVDMSDLPVEYVRSAPLLGEHTQEILTELGYSDDAIQQLRDQAVV